MADMYAGGSANFDEKTGMYKPGTAPTMGRKPIYANMPRPARLTQAERMAERQAKRAAEDARDAARKAAREVAKKPAVKPAMPKREEKDQMTRKARQAALAAKRKTRSGQLITGASVPPAATGMGA